MEPEISPELVDRLGELLPSVAADTVAGVIREVPDYADALTGVMGRNIARAVQMALSGFLSLARAGNAEATPVAATMAGAYELGRGEARSGRSMDSLLAAYRVGARVSWREMSTESVRLGMPPEMVARFAEMVFAYIDELSASSVAGHTDALNASRRDRSRQRERLGQSIVAGAPADALIASAERAQWTPPKELTAVVVPAAQGRAVASLVSPETLRVSELPGESGGEPNDWLVYLVPDASGARRERLLKSLADKEVVVGPAKPWLTARDSWLRAERARVAFGPSRTPIDTDARLAELVVGADPEALADLRARVLAPLADLKPATAEKLTQTLRAWLLHQGRRDAIAETLFLHPQTIRYRMGQLRELFGDSLEDPDTIRDLTIALT